MFYLTLLPSFALVVIFVGGVVSIVMQLALLMRVQANGMRRSVGVLISLVKKHIGIVISIGVGVCIHINYIWVIIISTPLFIIDRMPSISGQLWMLIGIPVPAFVHYIYWIIAFYYIKYEHLYDLYILFRSFLFVLTPNTIIAKYMQIDR